MENDGHFRGMTGNGCKVEIEPYLEECGRVAFRIEIEDMDGGKAIWKMDYEGGTLERPTEPTKAQQEALEEAWQFGPASDFIQNMVRFEEERDRYVREEYERDKEEGSVLYVDKECGMFGEELW